MWEDNLSQPLTSVFSEVELLVCKNNLKQLQSKRKKKRGQEEEMSIFHFCRKLQGTSGGHRRGPKITPTGTHWKSAEGTTALSSLRPPCSPFNMPVSPGSGDSWARDSCISPLCRRAGFHLYSCNWKSPTSLTSTGTDTKWCLHTTCNTHLNLSDTGDITTPPKWSPAHNR